MHIRTITKGCPAKAADIAYILDTLAQLLSILVQLQGFLNKE